MPSQKSSQKVPHGFLARTIYHNTLPDPPLEPKFLEYQFDNNRFTDYKTNTLENQHKIAHHVPRNLGIHIDLINPKAYVPLDKKQTSLHPADAALCNDEKSEAEIERSQWHRKQTNIFRRSEILSAKNKHFGKLGGDIIERQVGAGARMRERRLMNQKGIDEAALTGGRTLAQRVIKMHEEKQMEYKTREQQIDAIEKGFEAVKDVEKYYKHHTKKDVHAVEYLPIFPDFECWQHPCCQVVFQTDPAQGLRDTHNHHNHSQPPERKATDEELSQAMIRGMVDEGGEQFVGYFMPTSGTLEKRNIDAQACVPYDENEVYDYLLAKEYNWIVKNFKNSKSEQYFFFCWRNDQVFYNELDTKVRLTKRKKEQEKVVGNRKVLRQVNITTKAVLAVKHRALNSDEVGHHHDRFKSLTNEDEDSDSSSSSGDSNEDEEDNRQTVVDKGTVNTRRSSSHSQSLSRTGAGTTLGTSSMATPSEVHSEGQTVGTSKVEDDVESVLSGVTMATHMTGTEKSGIGASEVSYTNTSKPTELDSSDSDSGEKSAGNQNNDSSDSNDPLGRDSDKEEADNDAEPKKEEAGEEQSSSSNDSSDDDGSEDNEGDNDATTVMSGVTSAVTGITLNSNYTDGTRLQNEEDESESESSSESD